MKEPEEYFPDAVRGLTPPDPAAVRAAVAAALREDLPDGDATSDPMAGLDRPAAATFWFRDHGVIAGMDLAAETFRQIDPGVKVERFKPEGAAVRRGEAAARALGSGVSILKGERTALNFLQRLSGIASLTRRFVDAAAGSTAEIYDTRKTTPGLRELEKYAVRAGGGRNHRRSLSDAVLIKDNHIQLAGGIAEALKAHADRSHGKIVEIEVDTLEQLEEALEHGPDLVLLDNMDLGTIRKAARLAGGRCKLEVSGGVTLASVGAIADLGVHRISVGALTHSAPALDISLDLQWAEREA